jgi:AsmA protein
MESGALFRKDPPGRLLGGVTRYVLVLGGLAVALLALLAALMLIDVDAYRPDVEAAASRATGMSVTVEGPMRIRAIPRLHLTLGNVRIRNRGSEFAFAEEADVAVALLPLLRKELQFSAVTLDRVRIAIERDQQGGYNYERPPGSAKLFPALALSELHLPNLTVVYTEKRSGIRLDFRACNGELTDVRHPGDAPILEGLSLAGKFACGEVHGMGTILSDLKLSVLAKEGVFAFRPITLQVRGGQGSGSLHLDRSVAIPTLDLSYSLTGFRLEEFFKGLLPGLSADGRMDFSTTLAMRGHTRPELLKSAMGRVSLSGSQITLTGVDLDKTLSNYASSQNFNLFDLSAVLLAGPLGLLATRGYEFAGLLQEPGGRTQIRTVVSLWKVVRGVAIAEDVALATGRSRLALHGGLDFVDDEYDEVFVAVLDANGCATVRQRIRGPFGKPVVEKPSVLTSIAGPVLNLFNIAAENLPGMSVKCKVFYSGSVAHPQ